MTFAQPMTAYQQFVANVLAPPSEVNQYRTVIEDSGTALVPLLTTFSIGWNDCVVAVVTLVSYCADSDDGGGDAAVVVADTLVDAGEVSPLASVATTEN